MKKRTMIAALAIMVYCLPLHAQDQSSEAYLEFNDRNNRVHGVYLGINAGFGRLEREEAYLGSLKFAYVANKRFEVGLTATFLFSEQKVIDNNPAVNDDLIGVYGGLHLEPIFFGSSRVNLSFPITIGGGTFGFIENYYSENESKTHRRPDDFDEVFIVEPGAGLLFNISRYLQLETVVRYRLSSNCDLRGATLKNLNGFTVGLGMKIGVFNLGRNRYKQNI